jgi:hypothetical protein
LELSEFRLILSKNWDLNVNQEKSSQAATKTTVFDAPQNPLSEEICLKSEQEQDSEVQGEDLQKFFTPVRPALAQPSLEDEIPTGIVQEPEPAEPPDIEMERSIPTLRRSARLAPPRMEISNTEFEPLWDALGENASYNSEDVQVSQDTKINIIDSFYNITYKENERIPETKITNGFKIFHDKITFMSEYENIKLLQNNLLDLKENYSKKF